MALTPPDSDERLFLRVVEAGSLKAAAQQVGSDPSAISRRLAALEQRLGQRLLKRSTRGSGPTEIGWRYYAGLAPLVAQQDALEAAVVGAADAPQGRLCVTAPPEFGVRFVVPVLEALQQRYPELTIDLSLGTAFRDLGAGDIDVAVRIGTLGDSALRARRLGSVPRVLVAAPRYLDAHGRPENADDLADHRFVAYGTVRGETTLRMRTGSDQVRELQVRPHFIVNSIPTLVRLVETGQGLCLAPLWAVDEAIKHDRVRCLLADCRFDSFPVHALYVDRRYLPSKTRVFIEAIAEHIAREPSLEAEALARPSRLPGASIHANSTPPPEPIRPRGAEGGGKG